MTWILHNHRKDGIYIIAEDSFDCACSRLYLNPAHVKRTRQPLGGDAWCEEVMDGTVRFYGGAVISANAPPAAPETPVTASGHSCDAVNYMAGEKWIRRMAEAEDGCPTVTAGVPPAPPSELCSWCGEKLPTGGRCPDCDPPAASEGRTA